MQGDRGIIEFTYKYPGMYMFHSHKNEFSMKGWLGFFDVTKPTETGMKTDTHLTKTTTILSSSTPTHTTNISKPRDTRFPGLEVV